MGGEKSLMINLECKKPYKLLFGGFFFRIESKFMGEYTPMSRELCSALIPGMCNVYTPAIFFQQIELFSHAFVGDQYHSKISILPYT